ncbi:MAG TPA: palindromic element RPE4 domain-containing protein [Rickettsia endosymbiont of Bembidion nr. Transversale]|nr:palindromic element RPE4 domain-containing protein [Rickettsia endosymbiont of Bembidion nr. Transversale]
MAWELDPEKNTNKKLDLSRFMLDPVVKPRDDYLRTFFDPRGQCPRH